MRICSKPVLGILVLAAFIAVIAGLFLGVRRLIDTSSINVDPTALETVWPSSCMLAALSGFTQHAVSDPCNLRTVQIRVD